MAGEPRADVPRAPAFLCSDRDAEGCPECPCGACSCPLLLVAGQEKVRCEQGRGAEVVRVASWLGHRSPSHLIHLRRACESLCCLVVHLLRRKRRQRLVEAWERWVWQHRPFSILEGRPPPGTRALSATGCPINSHLPPFINSRFVPQGHHHHLVQIRQVRGQVS